jgi:hypothetical protein
MVSMNLIGFFTKTKAGQITALAVGLLFYIAYIVPFLENLVQTQGILIAYPLFLFSVSAFSVMIGKVSFSRKVPFIAIIIFMLLISISDLLYPPWAIPRNQPPAEQMLKIDLFMYKIYSSLGMPHRMIYWTTYVITPILALLIVFYLTKSRNLFSVLRWPV